MPMYEFKCDKCGGSLTDIYDYDNIGNPLCCKKPMRRVFSMFRAIIDFRDGFDIGLGKYFNTARERNNYIAEHDIRRLRS